MVKASLNVGRPSFATNINLKLHIIFGFDSRILLAVGKYSLLYSAKRGAAVHWHMRTELNKETNE